MQIDKLCLAIYPRNSWQAMDLGCQMAIRWWAALSGYWLIVTLPVLLVTLLISIEWGILIFWWFKPWYERGLLYILSRQVFGENVTAWQAVKALPSQIKPLWFSSVTWRRLSPSRAFDLPVAQLEGLRGHARTKRLNTLHRTSDDNSRWWLIICVHWELIILVALFAALMMLIPQGLSINPVFDYIEGDVVATMIYNVFYYVAVLVVAPFYVAGSFAAYLNRRVNLEGWDIELDFKRIAQQAGERSHQASSASPVPSQKKPSVGTSSSAAVLLAMSLSLFCTMHSQPAAAQSGSEPVVIQDEAINEQSHPATEADSTMNLSPDSETLSVEQQLEDILGNPPFAEQTMEKRWRWVGWQFDWEWPSKQKNDNDSDFTWIIDVLRFIFSIAEYLLWGAFLTVLGALLWMARHHLFALAKWRPAQPEQGIAIPHFVQMPIESDTEQDPSELAKTFYAQQEFRKLLSVLLVDSLSRLAIDNNLRLRKSMTEKECLEEIERHVSASFVSFMRNLMSVWVNLAWAHIWPEPATMQALLEQWQQLFPATSSEADV